MHQPAYLGLRIYVYSLVHKCWPKTKWTGNPRLIIKILTHPCYRKIFDCFSWGWIKKNSKMAHSKKTCFLKPSIHKIFWRKSYRLVLRSVIGISKTNWCEGHQFGSTTSAKLYSSPWKAVSWVAMMGRNLDDYSGFQPIRSWPNTYAQDIGTR